MGYRSNGYGNIVLKNGASKEELCKFLKDEGFGFSEEELKKVRPTQELDLGFDDWKMYGDGMTTMFQKLAGFGDFFFDIVGEDQHDEWRLKSVDGKLFALYGEFVWGVEWQEKTDLG